MPRLRSSWMRIWRDGITVSEITLTKEQWNRLPYKNTTITKGRTYGDIIGMLEEHGITGYVFGNSILVFPIKFKYNDREIGFTVKMNVPRLMYEMPIRKGRGAPKTLTYLENVSWRMFYWYLEKKLQSIEFGISDEVREFMYNINYKLSDNRGEASLSETFFNNLDRLDRLNQLEDHSGRKIIEAEVDSK